MAIKLCATTILKISQKTIAIVFCSASDALSFKTCYKIKHLFGKQYAGKTGNT